MTPDSSQNEATPSPSPSPVTIAERMAAAGISAAKTAAYLERGDVQLDGEPVTDPATPAPWSATRWAINPA